LLADGSAQHHHPDQHREDEGNQGACHHEEMLDREPSIAVDGDIGGGLKQQLKGLLRFHVLSAHRRNSGQFDIGSIGQAGHLAGGAVGEQPRAETLLPRGKIVDLLGSTIVVADQTGLQTHPVPVERESHNLESGHIPGGDVILR